MTVAYVEDRGAPSVPRHGSGHRGTRLGRGTGTVTRFGTGAHLGPAHGPPRHAPGDQPLTRVSAAILRTARRGSATGTVAGTAACVRARAVSGIALLRGPPRRPAP